VGVSEEKTKDNICLFLVARIEEHNCNIILPISPWKLGKVKPFGSDINRNCSHEEIKTRLYSVNAVMQIQNLLSSHHVA